MSESVVKGEEPAHYFSRGQRVQFVNMLREENDRLTSKDAESPSERAGVDRAAEQGEMVEGEEEEGNMGFRAYG